MEEASTPPTKNVWYGATFDEMKAKVQMYVLDTKQYTLQRWLTVLIIVFAFGLRVVFTGRYIYAAYILGVYFLQSTVFFVSPKIDPETEKNEANSLPTGSDFKPFVRKLPEFLYWQRLITASLLALLSSFLPFDLPVHAPLLILYFICISIVTFHSRIDHMIRYKYVPWDTGKK